MQQVKVDHSPLFSSHSLPSPRDAPITACPVLGLQTCTTLPCIFAQFQGIELRSPLFSTEPSPKPATDFYMLTFYPATLLKVLFLFLNQIYKFAGAVIKSL